MTILSKEQIAEIQSFYINAAAISRETAKRLLDSHKELDKQLTAAQSEITKLKAVLAFYAKDEHYRDAGGDRHFFNASIDRDHGKRARAALGKGEG